MLCADVVTWCRCAVCWCGHMMQVFCVLMWSHDAGVLMWSHDAGVLMWSHHTGAVFRHRAATLLFMELQGVNDILELLRHGWLLLLKQNVAIGRTRNHNFHSLLLPFLIPLSGVGPAPTAMPWPAVVQLAVHQTSQRTLFCTGFHRWQIPNHEFGWRFNSVTNRTALEST